MTNRSNSNLATNSPVYRQKTAKRSHRLRPNPPTGAPVVTVYRGVLLVQKFRLVRNAIALVA